MIMDSLSFTVDSNAGCPELCSEPDLLHSLTDQRATACNDSFYKSTVVDLNIHLLDFFTLKGNQTRNFSKVLKGKDTMTRKK